MGRHVVWCKVVGKVSAQERLSSDTNHGTAIVLYKKIDFYFFQIYLGFFPNSLGYPHGDPNIEDSCGPETQQAASYLSELDRMRAERSLNGRILW